MTASMSIILVLPLFFTSACASNKGIVELQRVTTDVGHISLIRDEPTRAEVLEVIAAWLAENGYDYSVLEPGQKPSGTALNYRAWWGWDVGIYMKRVNMQVARNGTSLGKIKFDALQYGGFGKFGSSVERLRTLLDALFAKIDRDTANELLGDQ